MKNRPDHTQVPQTEALPEGFPDVTTMPKGWDTSELVAPQPSVTDGEATPIALSMDMRKTVNQSLA